MVALALQLGCSELLGLDEYAEAEGDAGSDADNVVDAAPERTDVEASPADVAPEGPADAAGEEPACNPGLTDCSGTCVNTSNDIHNCGTCGHTCPGDNATCNGGSCACTPSCVTVNGCGSDGCGGTCGSCVLAWDCWQGYCVKIWETTGAWNCHQKCGGNTAADPSLTCVGSAQGSCDDYETTCYCWCSVPGTCGL